MAEAVAFTLASKVLSAIASPAIIAAYKEGLSIKEAEDELSKLQVTIQTIQAMLFDAEKKQQNSDAVKNWIKRLKGVLYDADDLFDEVATRDLLKQQIQKGSHNCISKKVLVSCFKLNPVISKYSIAKEVKAIRKSLVEISTDMALFGFMICQNEVPTCGIRTGQDPGCFVNAELVIGRGKDEEVVLKMLFDESNSVAPEPLVIAIVGIGGLGKTTLSQLIYSDYNVEINFKNRWFACISDTSDEREVLGKILQSIRGGDHSSSSVSELKTGIMNSVKDEKFFLVLDDVWDDHRGRWQDRMSLLSSCAKGSRIIVTTRSLSVAHAVNASGAHNLEGLSEEDAWCLFKRIAFAPGYENDPERISSGKEILKICRGVPLAIRSVGSLLSERNTISEWQSIEREGLQKIGKRYHDETMSVIKLSYDHLPSNLKHCFAYCSLFPKDHKFIKRELMHLWSAQGYIEPNSEDIDFMHLLRRGFFQESVKDFNGEVISCKMHDIMHDLAIYVSGEESITMSGTTSNNTSSFTRHVSIEGCEREVELLKVERLHSFFWIGVNPNRKFATLYKLFESFKVLHTLSLKQLGLSGLPPSIGELKLMRYLDLSSNNLLMLPDSITNLVNLFALNLESCSELKALPEKFEKLIKLRYLNNEGCSSLQKMPIGIGELTRLEYLSVFVLWKGSGLDALAKLRQQLRGKLSIKFKDDPYVIKDEYNWKLPVNVQILEIESYLGIRIPDWATINGIERTNNHLTHLTLKDCGRVKRLSPLHYLPYLRWLEMKSLYNLEFVEAEEDYSTTSSSSLFFPRLEKLKLWFLPDLKRWRKKTTPTTPLAFPLLSDLEISSCKLLEMASFPQCPRLQKINIWGVDNSIYNGGDMQSRPPLPSTLFFPSVSPPPLQEVSIRECKWLSSLQHFPATASLRQLDIRECSSLKTMQLASPHLERVHINCEGLVSLEVVATPSLTNLTIKGCNELKNLIIDAPLNALKYLDITYCTKLDFLKLELDWDYLVNLRMLVICPMPPTENIPLSLRNRQSIGQLKIADSWT